MKTRPVRSAAPVHRGRRAFAAGLAAAPLGRLGVFGLLGVVGSFGLPSPALAFGLADLMALLAQRKSGEARFTEQRFVAGLEQPLVSSGTLSYTAPDQLARRTTSPRPEAMVVDGNRVTLERGGRVMRTRLDTLPEVAGMVAALRGTLTGNVGVLREYFEPSVDGSAARWVLTLLPIDERLQGVLRSLRFEGQRDEVRAVEVVLADGDRSRMTIETLPGKP